MTGLKQNQKLLGQHPQVMTKIEKCKPRNSDYFEEQIWEPNFESKRAFQKRLPFSYAFTL